MKGGLDRVACRAGTRDFSPALTALICPVQNIFSSPVHYFNCFVANAQQARQSAVLGRLSLNMSLGVHYTQYLADHPSRDAACAHADRSGRLQALLHPGRKNIL